MNRVAACARPAPTLMLVAAALFVGALGALLGLIWSSRMRARSYAGSYGSYGSYGSDGSYAPFSLEGFDPQGETLNPTPAKAGRLVYLHLDGCPHCVTFTPRWSEFARAHSERLAAAGVSVESHEARSPQGAALRAYVTSGYPTVLFVPAATDREPVVFEGPRTPEGLSAFVDAQLQR